KLTAKDLLVPVFDAKGAYVYQEPKQKETYAGSGIYTTDLPALTKFVKAQLQSLPEAVRRVTKKPDDALKDRLLALFNKAQAEGDATLTLDIAALTKALPENHA